MDREQERQERKRAIAREQAERFEDQKSEHELVLARLEALPDALRGAKHAEAVEAERRAIAILDLHVATTLTEAEA